MLAQVITDPHNKIGSQIDLCELRLDYWPEFTVSRVEQFIAAAERPVILTLRSQSEDPQRIELLRQLFRLSPDYIDLEHTLDASIIDELHAINPRVKIIRSYHNFTETPSDLDSLLADLQHEAVHTYKLATMANSTLDALRMLQLVQQHNNLIGLCMGELGSCTRILAPVVGGRWTYVMSADQNPVVPGMLTADELVQIYRYPKLNKQTKIYALIGDPVVQSVGHLFHNDYFQEHEINSVYLKLRLLESELADFFQIIKNLNFHGLSVTMPLKESVLFFVHNFTEIAKNVGAVNTLSIKNNSIYATNTDLIGAIQPLQQRMDLQQKNALVIGAGGAAKAISYGLSAAGAQVTIVSRHRALQHDVENFDVVINTVPNNQETADFLCAIVNRCVSSNTLVMDAVYKPKETTFIQQAKACAAQIIYGEEMFLAQAIEQQKFWSN